MNKINFLVYCFLFFSTPSFGIEIYSFYKNGCDVLSGAVINVDETRAIVLELDGKLSSLKIDEVQLIARYDLLENPFSSIEPGKDESALLLVMTESDKKDFLAYATNFFEDMVLFLDLQGKIRVVELDDIVALKRVPMEHGTRKLKRSIFVKLVSPPEKANCPILGHRTDNAQEMVSTRVIGDKLKIDSFFGKFREGYRNLESLRERTMFYARPVLYNPKTRLGFVYMKEKYSENLSLFSPSGLENNMPIYFDISSGSAYRFQSSTSIGTKTWRTVPQIRPIFGITSEFKSHLIHGIFTGNINGLTAGKPIYGSDYMNTERNTRKKVWGLSSFNHLTLLGADYHSWSVSYGYYFPTFAFGQRDEFREVLSSSASFVGRLAYLQSNWQAEFYFYLTNLRHDIEADPADLKTYDTKNNDLKWSSIWFVPRAVKLTSNAIRFNLHYFPTNTLYLIAEASLASTYFQENSLRREEPLDFGANYIGENEKMKQATLIKNKFSQLDLGTKLSVRLDLGQWVGLKGEIIYEYMKTKGGFQEKVGEPEESVTDQIFSYLGGLEFIL